ncbi:hypothetical protein [Chengkuizengella axinellae]|uniref:Uncharacterized protein n=1 Tax=Chengkuizengella axinellae TaxID=3064388 RepID=A0ABT9J3X8_9BACL|nr:hypothetical protein [Chengkuizengella sp. 2205SS18-9]MDP5276342.1 hypothetical protein [Chengkuizengella sp. 2205SS18-9]
MKKRFTSLAILILCFTLAVPVYATDSPPVIIDPTESFDHYEFWYNHFINFENLVAPTIKVAPMSEENENYPVIENIDTLVAPGGDGGDDEGGIGGKTL